MTETLTLEQLHGRMIALEERMKKLEGGAQPPTHGKTLPFPIDLDGPYGDPEVRFDPRAWSGRSYKGQKFSQCPAEYLEKLASAYDFFADKADRAGEVDAKGRPKATWDRMNAAKARAWAERNSGAGSAMSDEPEQDDLF